MFNVKDIVKYTNPINTSVNWGIITDIVESESNIHEYDKKLTFRIQPLEDEASSHYDITEYDILESYSKIYEKNDY